MLTSELLADVPHGFFPSGVPPPSGFAHCRQVHGARVLVATGDPIALAAESADGLISESPAGAAMVTADCLPVLIAGEGGRRVAAVHAGWRGLASGVLAAALAHFDPREVRVVIGPAVGGCCYEIGMDVIAQLKDPAWSKDQSINPSAVRPQASPRNGGVWLDIYGTARRNLESLGVRPDHIARAGSCTYCGPELYASYRRNTHEKKPNRSQWSWIGARPR